MTFQLCRPATIKLLPYERARLVGAFLILGFRSYASGQQLQ